MAEWQFVIGQREPQVLLPTATGRRVDLRLRAPSSASFTIDANRGEAAEILELATDLYCYRDNQLVFRGVVGTTSDAIDTDRHTVTVEAVDYRARLSRVLIDTEVTLAGESDADLVWSLLETAQARTAGNLGITRGAARAVFTPRTDTLEAGSTVFDAIEKFAQADPGFDWTITPELTLEMWSARGGLTDEVFTLGSSVLGLSRTFNPSAYANAIRGSGNPAMIDNVVVFTNEVFDQASGLASTVEGRWDTQRGWTDVYDFDVLTAKTAKALADSQVASEQYSLSMRDGWWQGVDHVDVGDQCRMVIQSGRLDLNRLVRVQDISIAIGDDGDEQVSVTTADVAAPYLLRAHEVERRLRLLERR